MKKDMKKDVKKDKMAKFVARNSESPKDMMNKVKAKAKVKKAK